MILLVMRLSVLRRVVRRLMLSLRLRCLVRSLLVLSTRTVLSIIMPVLRMVVRCLLSKVSVLLIL